jgi:hypothetical protein
MCRASLGIKVEQIVAEIKVPLQPPPYGERFKSIFQTIKNTTLFFKSINRLISLLNFKRPLVFVTAAV